MCVCVVGGQVLNMVFPSSLIIRVLFIILSQVGWEPCSTWVCSVPCNSWDVVSWSSVGFGWLSQSMLGSARILPEVTDCLSVILLPLSPHPSHLPQCCLMGP